MRAIVDEKISVRFCGGIRICIHMPLRVLRENLSRHGRKLTLLTQVTKQNDIMVVKTYGGQAFTLVEHVLYQVKYGHFPVM